MDDMKYELSDMDKIGITKTVKVLLFYELQPTIDPDKLITSLAEGVKNATSQLPFMAGNLEFNEHGKLCIVVSPGSQVKLNIRRFESKEQKSLSALVQDSFSPDNVDFTEFLPEEPTAPKQVCALQISLVKGGLILGLWMNHAAGDWSSIDTFVSLICQSCKAHREGLSMPTYTINLNRAPYNAPETGSTFSREEHLEKLPMFYVMEKSQFKLKPPPAFRSSIYRISEPSIQQLKARCTPHLTEVDYITSYDCISALTWTSITRARLNLHPEKSSSPSRFVHPIDVRTRDPEKKTSERYFGNAVVGSQAGPITAEALVSDGDRGIAAAATLIRQSINSTSLSTISHMTSLMKSLTPAETLGSRADFNDVDVFMNTWYSGNAEKYDIGDDSRPAAFRVPSSLPSACAVVLPNLSSGATRVFEVLVQVEVEEHEILRKDPEFLRYFEVVA
ncbi:transferase family protein [Aspergillus nomiae NRRL 13137]|uniref:Transferase family protein n=1 Tax=Aspergillus nomiae NRRL (strain ATCC 15546 / NRRL 13137 / CBS 260.88 / M93) TaxID=1509407 RepID=A0A0L1ITE5_ASPN3|nr:transferase family protein [Aspergillus nomiae NRRL 13137]KNG82670.1 transferase family protein [Aspergillus nomiae NRRL 13137]